MLSSVLSAIGCRTSGLYSSKSLSSMSIAIEDQGTIAEAGGVDGGKAGCGRGDAPGGGPGSSVC